MAPEIARSPSALPEVPLFRLLMVVDAEPWAGEISGPEPVGEVASPAEYHACERLPEVARRAAFVRMWTQRESALKACGKGLSGGMTTVRLRPDFSGLDEAGWFSSFVPADPDHAVVLAWRGGPADIRVESFAFASSF